MRKTVWVFVIGILLAANVSATGNDTKKDINILATIGFATSGFSDPLVDFGIEFQLTGGLYVQFLANTRLGSNRYPGYNGYDWWYLNDSSPYIYANSSTGYWGGVSIGNTLYGFNVYSVFKKDLSKKITFFCKGGVNITFYDAYDLMDMENKKHGFGFGVGSGFEYHFRGKVSLIAGGTYKKVYDNASNWRSEENINWVTFYGGIQYHLK